MKTDVVKFLVGIAFALQTLKGAIQIDPPPLTEFPAGYRYQGETGGLYGHGANQPPPMLLDKAMKRAGNIRPLNRAGAPAEEGRVGLICIGMSNTAQEFAGFQRLARADQGRNAALTLVNGAQGGMDSAEWARTADHPGENPDGPWVELRRRIDQARLTPSQVQVVWICHARRRPQDLGAFPAHAQKLEEDLRGITRAAAREFPNLKLIYLSSRNYGGYATRQLNPEPYAFESCFAVRRLVLDPANGSDEGPVLLWGPYTWAGGTVPRRDGLVWLLEDFNARDGTHPSELGKVKTARLLLDFFRQDPTASGWWSGGSISFK